MKLYTREVNMCINCPAIMGLYVGAWCNKKKGLKITEEYEIHPDCPLKDSQQLPTNQMIKQHCETEVSRYDA